MKDITYYKQFEPIDGKWRITKRIGEGSYGQVFEIERIDEDGSRFTAALKAITVPASDSELAERRAELMDEQSVSNYYRSYVEDIKNELRIMNELKGKTNIVSYEDHLIREHEDGIGADILIRMELLKPLNAYIRENGFTEKEVIHLGMDICTALELCFKKNLIHRDIKPGNIFISDTDDFKLGDFGIARIVEGAFSELTSAIGTESYMSPEVYRHMRYGSTADIYSLGMVLYHLTNNNRGPFLRPGFSGNDRTVALDKRMRGETLPRPENCSEELWEVIRRACAYDPRDRYQTPTEMKEALRRLESGAGERLVLPPFAGGQRPLRPAAQQRGEPDPTVGQPVSLGGRADEDEPTAGKLRVLFFNGEREISRKDYKKGAPVIAPKNVTRPDKDNRRYVFVGWNPEVNPVAVENATYYAVFREELIVPPVQTPPPSERPKSEGKETEKTKEKAEKKTEDKPEKAKKKLPWPLIAAAAAVVVALGILIPVLVSASSKPQKADTPAPGVTLQEAEEESEEAEEPAREPEEDPAEEPEEEEPEEEPEEDPFPIELEWGDWTDDLPAGVSGENSALEVRLVYHSTPIVTFTDNPSPGEQYVSLGENSYTDYSPWGEWQPYSYAINTDDLTEYGWSDTEPTYGWVTVSVPAGPDEWTDYISEPLPGFVYSKKEESGMKGSSARYYGHFVKTEQQWQQTGSVTTYYYRKRSYENHTDYYFYDKTNFSEYSTTPVLTSEENGLYASNKMQYRYASVEDGVFNRPSMENFQTFSADYRGRFADVDPGKWYAPERSDILRTVCEYSFLLPDRQSNFRPEENVTLGQAIRAAVMIYRVYNGCSALLCENDGKYDRYIDYAVEHGLMKSGELTELDRAVTRQELAYLFNNALPEEELSTVNNAERITDMDMSSKYYDCALTLACANVIQLRSDGTFRPEETATRAEMASMIDRMIYPAHRASAG